MCITALNMSPNAICKRPPAWPAVVWMWRQWVQLQRWSVVSYQVCCVLVPGTEGSFSVCLSVCVLREASVKEPKHDTALVVPGCPSIQQALFCLELGVSGISSVARLLEALEQLRVMLEDEVTVKSQGLITLGLILIIILSIVFKLASRNASHLI